MIFVLSLPVVQTEIGRYATNRLNKEFGTNIKIGRVNLSFLGDVGLKNVYVEDYKKDTLFYIKQLNTSVHSVRDAIKGKLEFDDVDIDDIYFNMKTYKDTSDTNLDVFVAKFEDPNDTIPSKEPFKLNIKSIHLANSHYKLTDENLERPTILNFSNLKARITDFGIVRSDVKANIHNLTFEAKRGLEVTDLSTKFDYTLSQMRFDDFHLKTLNSNLKGNIVFNYKREDFSDFVNKVNITANFDSSTIALNEVNLFYNEFGNDKIVTFSTQLDGVLNSFTAEDLIMTSERTLIKGNFTFQNLFEDNKPFRLDAYAENLSSNYYQLKALLPDILGNSLPSSFAKFGQFSIDGPITVTETAIDANINLHTDIGFSHADMVLSNIQDIDNARYKGLISLKNFDLSKFGNDKKLGKATLEFNVDGKGFTQTNLNTKVTGSIASIAYNKYAYKNIKVAGTVANQKFDGTLDADDKNFQISFKGLADFSEETNAFNFTADVKYADLNALNFVSRDSISIFKGQIKTNLRGNSIDDMVGILVFTKTSYKNQNDTYVFDDFLITSKFEHNERVINFSSPDIITGYVRGNFKINQLDELVLNSIGSIFTNYTPRKLDEGQHILFNFKIYNKIVEVFYPELQFGKNTYIRGNMVADEGKFKLTFRSPKINAFGNTIDDINLEVDNKNPVFNTFVEIGNLKSGFYNIHDFNLINTKVNDTLFFKSVFKGGTGDRDDFNLNFYQTYNKQGKAVVGFKKSNIGIKGNVWHLNEEDNKLNKVVFSRDLDSILIRNMVMTNGKEKINFEGKVIDTTYKEFNLNFKNVRLSKITPSIDSLKLNGLLNGELNILQKNKEYLPVSQMTIDSLKINNILLGDLDVGVMGNQDLSQYNVDARLINNAVESLNVTGNMGFTEHSSSVNLEATLKELNLKAFSPLGADVISNIRGFASGKANITGKLSNPSIDGQITVEDGGLKIPYLNVDLDFQRNAIIGLHDQTFEFNHIDVTDTKYKTTANLNGTITQSGFSDWYLDLNIDTTGDRFLVLDTPENDEALYYGTGFIKGDAHIFGLTDQLNIVVNAETKKGTSLKIPISDVTSIGDASFINFIDKNKKSKEEEEKLLQAYQGLELEFNLDITPEAQVEIVVDKQSGSTLRGTGYGSLLIDVNTNGKFRMFGNFITVTGDFNFKYRGLIDKKFKVLPGGYINWDGDPLKADLDMQALYTLYANPAVLQDSPSIRRNIETQVIIHLTDQLTQPNIDYQIKFPGTSSVVNSELQYKLEDENRRELQALSLLSQGTFVNEVTISQQALTGNLLETASSLVNQILNDDGGKFNVGISYEQGTRDPQLDYQIEDRFGVTVSTQINDRILVNGKVGVPVGGVSESVVAGDVEVQVLLNEDGTLSARIFNRESEIQQFLAQQQGYTQGVGLSYQVDFNTFKELLRKIFNKKDKAPKQETPVPATDDQNPNQAVQDRRIKTMGNHLINVYQKEGK
ncbi:translocation/assembly module TamB domain-containing protein [Zhouia sp. PK063]|uniref:translocation/assembly module TamB domain-containing protein n=1 Tax=Zhouia sp. PK063 TaxID=3373602 RepID=UPI0037B207A0